MVGNEFFDHLVRSLHFIAEVEWYGPFDTGDELSVAAGAPCEIFSECVDVAEGCRHEQELGVGHHEQWHLPRPPAVGFCVVMELVHHDLCDAAHFAVAQGKVCENLGGAADNRRVGVNGAVTRHHADTVCSEGIDEFEKLFTHERFDGCGVHGASTLGECNKVCAERDE